MWCHIVYGSITATNWYKLYYSWKSRLCYWDVHSVGTNFRVIYKKASWPFCCYWSGCRNYRLVLSLYWGRVYNIKRGLAAIGGCSFLGTTYTCNRPFFKKGGCTKAFLHTICRMWNTQPYCGSCNRDY